MRLLVTIPHYYLRDLQGGFYGSERDELPARLAAVTRCLAALHQTFGSQHNLAGTTIHPANAGIAFELDVFLVTTAQDHLAGRLPPHLFNHFPIDVPARVLGFACHKLMQHHAMAYDWFAYLEDDIEVTDALLFDKLGWFNGLFGDKVLLQPNRFEVADGPGSMKLYLDGGMMEPEQAGKLQDISVRPRLQAEAFGRTFVFQRVPNVHSGCFFASSTQLAALATDPAFGKPTDAFVGPLESAATLPIMRCFDVYKPALQNAAFLEVRHLGQRFLTGNTAE